MNHLFQSAIYCVLCFMVLFSCNNDPKNAAAISAPMSDTLRVASDASNGAAVYKVSEGMVHWSGTNTVSKNGHEGTITVESGELWVNQGQLLRGKATLDMNSISVSDIKDPGERRDLESHLKDADFFETNKYPKAEFVIEEVLPSTMPNFNSVLQGKLIMKGKTAPVNIPANIHIEGDILRAETPTFPINRTQWGVNFKSGILGTARDKMIDDNVPISLKLTARKEG
ncbi:MAG: YceI family protein [Saprospiraceae bacterium]|nr:YceI family protein [Saprospiraceae bacterium]